MDPIKAKDRRVANIHTASYISFLTDGIENGSVLQLNDAMPLGTGFHICQMAPGTTSIAHEHVGDEEFLIIEGELVDHDGTTYRQGDLVWLRDGTIHSSYTPEGCLIAVYVAAEEKPVQR